MLSRVHVALLLPALLLISPHTSPPAPACCPAPPPGKPVVNADQTVILLWDADTKTEHFIRKASFQSAADDFGFLVPTPAQPELAESGNDAFPYLQKLTEPEHVKQPRPSGGMGCGCSSLPYPGEAKLAAPVRVLDEKEVAGFQATVLEADSADALVAWLKDHGYAFSPEVQAWAKPYVEQGWKITALKVAKGKENKDQRVAASSLRLSFKTERPLFPYREPDSTRAAADLKADHRLLRIYFIGDARYQGVLPGDVAWTGKPAWSGLMSAENRKKTLEMLKLPENTGPAVWWLTEFEDDWPYKVAPGDLTFARSADQSPIRRDPIIEYVAAPWLTDVTALALALVLIVLPLCRFAHASAKG
jgi:hypothetical protein